MFDTDSYQKYAAWIFDLDGTISNSLQAHDLAWEHALTQFAIPFTPLVAGVVLPFLGEKPMAVGTGCHTEMARRILAGLSLDHYLPVVVGADQVSNPKPAPDTFLLAAKKLGVKPEHCLVFEDADAGIKAAKAAGMDVVDVRKIWSAKKILQ